MTETIVDTREFAVLEDLSGRSSASLRNAALAVEVISGANAKGIEVHYLGTEQALADIASVLEIGCRALRMKDWPVPPIGVVVRNCREALPSLLKEGAPRSTVLGFMCLPPLLADRLIHKNPDTTTLLVIHGIKPSNPDVGIGLEAISACCRDLGVAVAMIP